MLFVHGSLLWRAHRHHALGREHQAAGRTLEAAREYQSAIGYYAPLNPWSRAAARDLVSLVVEQRGQDPALAFELEDRLRRSVQGTRWLVQPYGGILGSMGAGPGPPPRDPDPRLFFLSLIGLAAGFAGWWMPGRGGLFRAVFSASGLAVWALALRFC